MNDLDPADYQSAIQAQDMMPVDSYAYAQTSEVSAGPVLAFIAIIFIVSIAIYIYTAYCLYVIAKKANHPNPWYAYVPILNLVQMFQIIRQSPWWVLAMFVPFANIFVIIWAWMELAAFRNRPKWWGILMIISPINLILLWFMAFREGEVVNTMLAPAPTTTESISTPPSEPNK